MRSEAPRVLETPVRVDERRAMREGATVEAVAGVPERTGSTGASLRYMPQLDALRGLATLFVIGVHYMQRTRFVHQLLYPMGYAAIMMFYVLSGFLITLILLRCRDAVDTSALSVPTVAGRFYVRRFLRILPVYYAFLFLLAGLGVPPVRESFWWHFTYLSNIYFLDHPHGPVIHFWTLSIEEQFYLFWPLVILLIPRRHLLPVIVGAILLGPLYRAVGVMLGAEEVTLQIFTLACMDTLGLGGLLALCVHQNRRGLKKALCRVGLWVAFPASVFITGALVWQRDASGIPPGIALVFQQLCLGFFFVWLVDRTARGFGGRVGWWLERKPLLYLGKISYGVYLFHLPMIAIVQMAFQATGLPEPRGLAGFALKLGLTLLLASASWHFFEKPINGLKRHFRYTA